MTRLSDLIAPRFYKLHHLIKQHAYTHYWLKGGRGSTKSSFISIEIIIGMMQNPDANTVALRKVKDTLKESVFEQLIWAIEALGVKDFWRVTLSPLRLTYTPTGQRIIFRGLDVAKKIKSVKVSKGYIRYVWFEELDEFSGMEEIRTVLQSLLRGGEKFNVFYSFNPPKSVSNWVNAETREKRPDRVIHHSDYLSVPEKWLGEQFLLEAEQLKATNETAYKHEYLGEVVGTGGEVFANVVVRKITKKERAAFDRIRRGIDYGFTIDPFVYLVMHYDAKYRRIYIYHEVYKIGLSNRAAVDMIKKENTSNGEITADSAEPKSISEMRDYGLRITAAKKGPDSVEYGIKFLQDLIEIVIDEDDCPNAKREFQNYELEPDGNGGFKAKFPDKKNHTIDAARYALEDDMRSSSAQFINVRF